MLVRKITFFLLSKGKKKVISTNCVRVSWSFLCKMLSYVPMFTIQKKGGFSLFNPLLSSDRRSHEMCKNFFLSGQSFLKLNFHNQAEEDKHSLCWSGKEAETTEPCSHGAG